jgi:hypothetical protein
MALTPGKDHVVVQGHHDGHVEVGESQSWNGICSRAGLEELTLRPTLQSHCSSFVLPWEY